MNPILLVGPAVEPIPVDRMKAYLRLDTEDEDDLVEALVVAARITIEHRIRGALISQGWSYALTEWEAGRRIRLPLHPVRSVEEVRVSDAEGGMVALAPGQHRLEAAGEGAILVIDAAAPAPAGQPTRIEVDFTCGFGEEPASVPEPLVLAARRLVAYWFEHRGDDRKPGQSSIPPDVAALIAPFTRPRLA